MDKSHFKARRKRSPTMTHVNLNRPLSRNDQIIDMRINLFQKSANTNPVPNMRLPAISKPQFSLTSAPLWLLIKLNLIHPG